MKPSLLKCFDLLDSREWVSITDLLDGGVGSRYGARLLELRKLGCVIEVNQPRDRSGCTYRKVSGPVRDELIQRWTQLKAESRQPESVKTVERPRAPRSARQERLPGLGDQLDIFAVLEAA